jgi:prepilin-type N-terminal cleavage/methylation domain-containing protein
MQARLHVQRIGESRAAPWRGGCRRAFTLVEVLIVVVILGILAAIVMPRFSRSDDLTRTRVMAAGVRHIRELVIYHAAARDTTLSASGYPTGLDPDWFRNGTLPEHAWTGLPIIADVVSDGEDDVYPGTKTFNPATAGADNAWYNDTNGAFCVLVPPQVNDAATLQSFNDANLAQCTTLAQTTQ